MENRKHLGAGRFSKPMDDSSKRPRGTPASASIWSKHPWRMLVGAIVVVAATAAALTIDCPLASWCLADHCPGEIVRFLKVIEPFGNGFGVLVIALAVYQLDPRRRPRLARLLSMSLGAGLLADGFKMLVARTRPRMFDFHGGVAESFGRWLPLLDEPSGGQSFPSAHTATAVGLAIALGWLYPRGRWLFGALALLVACQRIESGIHFASDTIVGGAIGVFVAVACLQNGRLVHWFERIESHFAARQARAPRVEVESPTAESAATNPDPCDDPSRSVAA